MKAPVLRPLKAPVGIPTEQLRFLGTAHELEEGGPPRVASTAILAIFGLLSSAVAWAAFTPLAQIAVAPGQIVPSGAIVAVQHLEGGIVERVLVRDGDSVAAGQPILALQGAAAHAELKALQAKESALTIEQARLAAFLNGGALRGSLGGSGATPELVQTQTSILDAQRQNKEQQRTILERQLAAKRSDRATLEEQIALAHRQAALAVQEKEARRELFEKGLTTRAAYIEAQRTDNRAQGDLASLEGQMQRTLESIAEAEARLRELDARLANEAELENGRIAAELAQVRESLAHLADRADRLMVRAPAAGRVKDLKAITASSVLAPGMVVAEIVPQDQKLQVEARVSPGDIGLLKIGQLAEVKVESFPFSTFGAVPGRLVHVAASTTLDPNGLPYYKVVVALDRQHAGAAPHVHALQAGMTVQADVVTGERSVLQHLVAPVHTALTSALREQ